MMVVVCHLKTDFSHCVKQSVEKKGTFLGRLFGKRALLFLQVFSIIFFAEVGDKAQLSAIMLATREVSW